MSLVDAEAPVPVLARKEQATYRALAGESRQALLAALHQVGGPLDAGEAAASVGLHPNTARVHLEVLCSVGLVERRTEDRSRRGRPRVLYEVAPATRSLIDQRRAREADLAYRELARLLAQQFSELPDMPGEALRAGRRWAAVLSNVALPKQRLSPHETIGVAVDLLRRLGFDPEPGAGANRIVLHHCPFEEVARESRSVVCGIHLGMLKATVERLDSPLDVAGLEPFVTDEPSACIVHLAARE
jgi:predicted ArsR family transcriptional regulator